MSRRGILDSIIDSGKNDLENLKDKVTNRVYSEIEGVKKYVFVDTTDKMRNDASKMLDKLRSQTIGTVENAVDDMLQQMKTLSNKHMKSPLNELYDKAYNRVNGIIDKNLQLANQYLSGVAKGALSKVVNNKVATNIMSGFFSQPNGSSKKQGRGIFDDFLGGVGGGIKGILNSSGDLGGFIKVSSYAPAAVTRINKLTSQAYKGADESEWGIIDPASDLVDLTMYIKAALEESGYIADKFRATQYAKDLCFITRPTLESDNGGHYRSYAFFTRPNLNCVEKSGDTISLIPEMVNYPNFASLCMTDIALVSELCRDGAQKSNLFTYLNNYIKEVPPIRLAESNREGIKNMYGKSTPIPGIPEVYGEVDISVTFVDNARGDIAKLMYILSTYKSVVGREGFPMRPEYIKYKGIDYLMSLYIVTVDANWEIIGFGVAIGCMISEPPTHFTQHRMDGFSKNELLEEFTVNFKAATYFPFAPEYFDDFNRLSGFDPSNLVDTRGSGHALFVDTRSGATVNSEHNLRGSVWESKGGFDAAGNNTYNTSTGTKIRAPLANAAEIISRSADDESELTLDREVTVVNGSYKYKDTFELAAKCPGILTAVNSKEPYRRRFMLGFSY